MFQNANEFSMFIEKKALEEEMTYVETIIHFCEEHSLEPENIAAMINPSLKAKLEINFQDMNYIKKTAKLPV